MSKLIDKFVIVTSVSLVLGLAIVGQAHAGKPWHPGKYHQNGLTIDQMIDTSAIDKRDAKERADAQERLLHEMVTSKRGK